MSAAPVTKDWELRTVGSLARVLGGKRLPKGKALTATPTRHPYIRVTDMRPSGVDLTDIKYVPEEVAPSIRAYRIFPDDVFVSVAGTLGIVGRIPPVLAGANLTENADRITSISCDVDYLMYALLSEPIQAAIDAIRTVGAQPKLALGRIKQFEILIPKSRAEQERIAGSLWDIDSLIAALECIITKKQAMKHGMMQELLTRRTRLPGFGGRWQARRLGDTLSYEQPGRYLVQTSKQLEAGRLPVLTAGKTFVLGYTNETEGVYTAHPVIIFDDFTTASKYVDFDFKAKSSAMKILSARPGMDLRFIYERMQLIDFPLGDHKRYWISEYSNQEIEVPAKEEQSAISSVVASLVQEIDALKRRLAKARDIKQGMMQELLTGRLRLRVVEAGT